MVCCNSPPGLGTLQRAPTTTAAGLAALRPCARTLTGQNLVGYRDLLLLRGLCGVSDAAVLLPGGLLELQAAVGAVAGVGGPVAAGLALGDGVPVHGIGVGDAGGERHTGRYETCHHGGLDEGLCDVRHARLFARLWPKRYRLEENYEINCVLLRELRKRYSSASFRSVFQPGNTTVSRLLALVGTGCRSCRTRIASVRASSSCRAHAGSCSKFQLSAM